MSGSRAYARKQVALRQLCLSGGQLNANARVILSDLRKFCKADNTAGLQYNPVSGLIDPIATAAAVARREVFDRYARMLLLDQQAIVNLLDEKD
jgi:hypothetical protein